MAPVDGDFSVTLQWIDDDGRKAYNTFHVKCTAGTTAADVAAAVTAGPGNDALGPVSGHAAVREITVRNQFDETDAAVVATGLTGWTGGGGTGDYTPGMCAVLRSHTATAGRSGRGRMFLPFMTEAAVLKGRLTGDAATLTAPAWETWFGALSAGDHNIRHTVWSEVNGTGHVVTSESLNPRPGWRRKQLAQA